MAITLSELRAKAATPGDGEPEKKDETIERQGGTMTLKEMQARQAAQDNAAISKTKPELLTEPEPIDDGEPIDDPEVFQHDPGSFKFDDLLDFGVGAGEFLVHAATDLAGAFAGTVAAVTDQAINDKPISDAPELINYMRERFRYEPRSTGGKAVTQMIGDIFSLLPEAGEDMGEAVLEKTGSPALATAARIGPEAFVMLAPFAAKGRGPAATKVAKEVVEARAKAAAARKTMSEATNKKVVAMGVAQEELDKIRAKSKGELTAADMQRARQLSEEISKTGKEVAQERGLDFVTVRDTDAVMKRFKDADLELTDLAKVEQIVREAGEATTKGTTIPVTPVEIIVDGTKTTITGGREALLAAKLLGQKKVAVRTVVPKPKAKAVEAMAEQVNRVSEQSRILSEKLAKQQQKTLGDKLREQYDLTAPLKARLKKSLPDKEWVPLVARYIQMQNAGTGASLFAKDFFEPVFRKITGREVLTRQSGGKTIRMTDEMVLDEIVQSRLVVEIAKRRPKHKFSGKATSEMHQARLRQLEKELGPDEFVHLNDVASEVFDVYTRLLDLRRKEGLISPELYQKLKDFDYAPTEHLEFFDPVIAQQSGKGVRSSGVLKLQDGSYDLTEISAKSLLHDSINRTYNIIAKNRVLAELDNAIRANPQSPLAHHVKILKTSRTKGGKAPKKTGGAGAEAELVGAEVAKLPRGFERVEFFNQGKKRALAIDPYIASVWKTTSDVNSMRTGTQMLRYVTGVSPVKALAVGLNPAFPLVDVPRNIIGVSFSNSVSMSGVPMFGGRSLTSQGLFGLPISAGQMIKNMAIVAKDARVHGPLFRELAENNAFPRTLAEIGLDAFKEINRPDGLVSRVLSPRGQKFLDRTADALAYPGIYAETVMHMAVAKQALNRGLTINEAAAESLRMVNFNEAGYATARVDNFIPFFNAGFQASRAQFRAFKESPVRAAALGTSVMTLGFLNYWQNWLTNPEAVAKISDDDLATGFNFVMPKFMTAINPEGEVVHPYIHIPADGAAVPFVAASAWLMRRFNEHREPSTMLMDAVFGSTFPLLDVTGAPLATMTLGLFGNYDAHRGKALFPRDVGEPYEEYYGAHERNATPGIYVELGRKLWDSGLIQDTPLEGLASPERLRAAVDAYLPSNPISNSFSTIHSFLDPSTRELYVSNWELLDRAPFIGRLLRITNPNVNAWSDMDQAVGEVAAQRARAKRSVDEMAFLVAKGELKMATALSAVGSRFPEIDPAYRDDLARRLVVGAKAREVFQNASADRKSGIPGTSWWASLGAQASPVERARAYYKTWVTASDGSDGRPNNRSKMDAMLRSLSALGQQYRIMDSDGRFWAELNRLKRTQGTDFEPGILLDDVNYDKQQ